MAIVKTTGRAPDYVKLDPFQRLDKIHWPKDHGGGDEGSEEWYDCYFLYPPIQMITSYFYAVSGNWEVIGSRQVGYPSLGYAISGRAVDGPFTAGEAASALSIWNGWVGAYNSLGSFPAIEWSDPPAGVYAPDVIGLGISSAGGDASKGFGVGAIWVTIEYLTIGGPMKMQIKPYGA